MGAVSECLLVVLLIQYAAAYGGKSDGDACGPDDKWTCRSITQCPVARNELKNKRAPPTRVCSFVRHVPIVCCPPGDPTDRQAVIPEQKPKQSISQKRDACGPDDKWTCRSLAECPVVQKELKTRTTRLTGVCSFAGGVPIVCCPPGDPTDGSAVIPKQKPKQSISQKMCERYSKFVFSTMQFGRLGSNIRVDGCGRIEEPLFFDAKNASLKEFPHMAHIGFQDGEEIKYICGGSLISERWVLSSECAVNPLFGKAGFARLGELDTSSDNDGARPVVLRIIEHIEHKNRVKQFYNDIVLYKLESDVKLSSYIRPICLQVEPIFESPSVLDTSWRRNGEDSHILTKVWRDLDDGRNCTPFYPIASHIHQGIEKPKVMCTLSKENDRTCYGESGSPLQIPMASPYCMYSLVGMALYDSICPFEPTRPSVFTAVSNHVPWIEKHVWPNGEVEITNPPVHIASLGDFLQTFSNNSRFSTLK